ncbi:hypothetical protein TNCV_3432131 [Trichonephila clavipes]|nr:hypothetical protein TNCV_3432131 [Trichonephila clavipes]
MPGGLVKVGNGASGLDPQWPEFPMAFQGSWNLGHGSNVEIMFSAVLRPWVGWWLEHRTPDQKAWVRCQMPPNTLRVHTEYVLVKSVGPKVLWAKSRVQGTGEFFPHLESHSKIVEMEIGGVPSIVPSRNFAELIRTVTCMVLKA